MNIMFAICANHHSGSHFVSGDDGRNNAGGQCWLISWNDGNSCERNMMFCRSRGGRWVQSWQRASDMHNWRVKFVPLRIQAHLYSQYETREDAQAKLDEVLNMWKRWPLKQRHEFAQ